MLPMTLDNLRRVGTVVHRQSGEIALTVCDERNDRGSIDLSADSHGDSWAGPMDRGGVLFILQLLFAITGKRFNMQQERDGNKIYAPD